MSFRFWRRIRLAPGITLNLSKSTGSLSFGPRGAKYTIGPRGSRATVGLPGTGLFYTVQGPGSARGRGGRSVAATPPPSKDRLSLGFFRRLVTPAGERAFVDGLKALNDGDEPGALGHLGSAESIADAAWLAGMLHLKQESFGCAERNLLFARGRIGELGSLFAKYGIEATISLPITPEVAAHVRPRERGTLLALAELYQLTGRSDDAFGALERLLEIEPSDPVILLSFAELAMDEPDTGRLRRVTELTTAIENETPIHTALLLYRGRALSRLGLNEAALDVFTLALRRRKDRADELLLQIRYERALQYDRLGRKAHARRDLERVYAEEPRFEDVAGRLGL